MDEKKISKTCSSCGKVVKGQFIKALGGKYHVECFKCIDCKKPCGKKFFPCTENGVTKPLCEYDYFKRKGLICAKCGGAIRGPNIKALNKKYHLDHFTCTVCEVAFQSNDPYYEHDGKIYCQTHYSELFSRRCLGCQTPLFKQHKENKENIDPQEQWHPECYKIYKAWNVKVALEKEISKDSVKPGDFKAELKKQRIVLEKINKIWTILSSFEESSAECMGYILSAIHSYKNYSENDSYSLDLKGLEQAGNYVCHIDVLFSSIDEIETKLKKFNDRTGLQHTREPKLLIRRIINFFSLLININNLSKQHTTHKLLNLVTSLAHTLKVLIRYALNGALKLENEYNDKSALDSFLSNFLIIEKMQSKLSQELRSSTEYHNRSEYCPCCRKSVEEECIKFDNDCRWHTYCFCCQICRKEMYASYHEEARIDPVTKTLYCKRCSPRNTVTGFVCVTQLEQFTFLLKIALKELFIHNK